MKPKNTHKPAAEMANHLNSGGTFSGMPKPLESASVSRTVDETLPAKTETSEDLLFGTDTADELVSIVELDEDTKALIQTEYGQEESGENLSALFGSGTPSYGIAALGLGGAMAGMPTGGAGSGQSAMASSASDPEPQASGDASPFGPLLAILNRSGNAPTVPDQQPQDSASGDTSSTTANTSDGAGNTATTLQDAISNDLLPLLNINSGGVSSQAAPAEATMPINPPPALF